MKKENQKKLNWLGFQKKERTERIQMLKDNGFLTEEFEQLLKKNENLPLETANQMAENGIGTFALPFSVAPNFVIDEKDYAVPMVTEEPSVVAVDEETDEILAVGQEAKDMLGRTPASIIALRPLRDGVISDYDVTERMLKYFIKKTVGSGRFFKPRIMVCVPSGVTEVEKRAVREAAAQAGGKDVFLMEEPLAAAIGADLDISRPEGIFVVDIGGGTSDVAVISLGGIVASTSLKIAGDRMDEAIIKYMREDG